MAQVRCKQGLHFYDPNAHHDCPHCGCGEIGVTQLGDEGGKGGGGKKGDAGDEITDTDVADDEVTRAPDPDDDEEITHVKPERRGRVVGWLVVLEGDAVGRDHRLMSERNRIGRAIDNEVVIGGDPEVSRRHAVVSFDPKSARFFVEQSAEASKLTYLNGEPLVGGARPLEAWNVIEISDTKLLFVPLCGPRFSWESGVRERPAG